MPSIHAASHISEVEQVITGAVSARDQVVRESWKRCVEQHKLEPSRMQEAYILPHNRIVEHQDRLEDLLQTARFGLENLHQQIAGLGYVLLLSDIDGVTVDFMGDPTFDNNLRKAGLYLGANWKEEFAGTCAVGSCIATQAPLIVPQTDHFAVTHTPLTCSAAPIHDTEGRMIAVLDVSALRSPEAKDSQYLALQLVQTYCRRIELANLMSSFRSEWVVRFSRSHVFLDVEPECAVALDSAGRIVGYTHDAGNMLTGGKFLNASTKDSLLGKSLGDYLNFDINHLGSLTRATPSIERTVELKDGTILFAHAIVPQRMKSKLGQGKIIPDPLRELSGGDPVMDKMLGKAAKLTKSPVSILLRGETGTGKEFLARALHNARGDNAKFVAINCAALPETLIESELFGYAPGAFTGAKTKGKKGLIQQANGGTLFLDEIGDMPLALQARLLRVLSEKEVLPIGGDKPEPVNIRIIAATHQDLVSLVRSGKFREDLYYRLNGGVLEIPALRDRLDFDWLVDRLIKKKSDNNSDTPHLSAEARNHLKSHCWPGNIRELVNAIDYAKAVCEDNLIQIDDLPEFMMVPPLMKGAFGIEETVVQSEDARRMLEALKEHSWNISATARSLGIDRTTVHRAMKRFGIVPPNQRHF